MADVLPFLDTFTLRPDASELAVLQRSIEGDGGHQRLLRECLDQWRGGVLVLDALTLARVGRYAYDYGSGGYQDRFRTLVAVARRAGWVNA